MQHRNLTILAFLLSFSVLPVAVRGQQAPNEPQATPQVAPQSTPVQPERTPQQSDQARRQDDQKAEDTRINRDWSARGRGDERAYMDRMQDMDRIHRDMVRMHREMDRMHRRDQDREDRTVGQNYRRDEDDFDHSARYGSRDQDEDRDYGMRPRRRVKTCIEYDNGDEYCRYRD
jgi:hypothetical protein